MAAAKKTTIDEYLAAVSDEQRPVLQKLRQLIHANAPEAEEYIGYGLAAFRLHGKPLVAFGATPKHCAFYLMSNSTVDAHKDILEEYDTSTGTIRFAASKPLPAALVKKLVKARIAENKALVESKAGVKSKAGGKSKAEVKSKAGGESKAGGTRNGSRKPA